MVLLAFLVEDPAGEPVGERALGHAVVRGPGDAALPQLRVLEQATDLLVAQHRDAIRRGGIPAALPRLVDLVGGDGERRIGGVKRRDGPEGEGRHQCYLQESATEWSLNTLEVDSLIVNSRRGINFRRRAAPPATRRQAPSRCPAASRPPRGTPTDPSRDRPWAARAAGNRPATWGYLP